MMKRSSNILLIRSLKSTFPKNDSNDHKLLSNSDLRLFQRRKNKNKSSCISSYSILHAFKSLKNPSKLTEGIQIHKLVITLGYQSVIFLQTALITMYSKSNHMIEAHRMFDEMSHRNLIAWTSLITGYVNNKKPNKALSMFRRMQLQYVEPDAVTLTVALSACADIGSLDAGKWVHTYIWKHGLEKDYILNNALINMYCKCGAINIAHHLFLKGDTKLRDVTTWTSIIMGYASHGRGYEALDLFDKMKSDGACKPNSVTFVSVLTACSHGGLIKEGKRQWVDMIKYDNVKRNVAHYGCMVDLLCREGQVKEAYQFIMKMPFQANAVIWRTLMSACSLKGDVRIGNYARRKLIELDPEYVGDDVLMSNAYSNLSMWEEKEKIRRSKLRRAPGCSVLEIGSEVHEFVATDKRHVKKVQIREVLDGILLSSNHMDLGELSI